MERLARIVARLQYRITSYLLELSHEGRLDHDQVDALLELLSRGPEMDPGAYHNAVATILERVPVGGHGPKSSRDDNRGA